MALSVGPAYCPKSRRCCRFHTRVPPLLHVLACHQIYQLDAYRTDNLLLLGAVHFQLRSYSECIFYNQQAIRIDANFAGASAGRALRHGSARCTRSV